MPKSGTAEPRDPASLKTWTPTEPNAYLHSLAPIIFLSWWKAQAAQLNQKPKFDRAPDSLFSARLNRRFNGLVQRLHKMFDLSQIPDPQLVILANKDDGMRVMPINICVPMQVRINPGQQPLRVPEVIMTTRAGQPEVEFARRSSCLTSYLAPEAGARLETLLARPLKVAGTDCETKRTADGVDFTCPGLANLWADRISIDMQAPLVLVDAGFLAQIKSWDEFDAGVMHELGHYYLLHALRHEAYGWFYDRDTKQDAFQPRKDEHLDGVGASFKILKRVQRIRGFEGLYNSIASGELLEEIVSFANYIVSRPGHSGRFDPRACGTLRSRSPTSA